MKVNTKENWWNQRLIANRTKWFQEKRNLSPETARENAKQEFPKNFKGKDQVDKKTNRSLIANPVCHYERSPQLLMNSGVSVTTKQQQSHQQQQKADVRFPSTNIAEEIIHTEDILSSPFQSKFNPNKMRCLALVAHNHMKPAMKEFIQTNAEILKKFRLVGTNTTLSMCRSIFGETDKSVVYGPQCTSGPLGGDAELCAELTRGNIGGAIFFIDPLSAHPHQCDIDSFVRLCNVHNVTFSTNPTSAVGIMYLLRDALLKGNKTMMASFFETLESPAVPAYKTAQEATLQNLIDKQP